MSELRPLGIAGKFARAWINSKLTPLFIVAAIGAGAFAVMKLPREEEPQIIVPMVDVFVGMPGASPREVEERVTRPMEKLLWEIPGVEYLYSTSAPGSSMVIVRFKVGEDEERSLVKLNQKLQANFDRIPVGATPPLIKARSIDDVPILGITLWSSSYGDYELRRVAAQVHDAIKQTNNVSEVRIIGGQRRTVRVVLDDARLQAFGVAPGQVLMGLASANQEVPAGRFAAGNREIILEAGSFLGSAQEAGGIVLAVSNGKPVYIRDVATIEDGGEDPVQYVRHAVRDANGGGGFHPAVTIAVSKRKGANAIDTAESALEHLEQLKGRTIPSGVEVAITRQYGETAAEKSNELLFHMGIAVISVTILVGLTLGLRESLIVFAAIPVTLALTLTVFYLYGYTLNRITLFALIFSIGILVDDAIVVVENIVRHWRLPESRGLPLTEVAVRAVDEVGNPTILATLTVVAAILPMAFVGGLMGPYMRPIPIGASSAMIFSLIVAFIVTPWAAVRVLKSGKHHDEPAKEDLFTRIYRRFMTTALASGSKRWTFLIGVVVLLLGAMALVYIGFVQVKMLPFDNKSEFQVIVDMPEGTTLEQTERVTRELAQATLKEPEVVNVQTYAGTAAPYNFNGLVRHYFLRGGSNVADIQVNLTEKGERSVQSHDIAKRVRQSLFPIAKRHGARIKVAEVPPGPPVLQTLVAEIYGPDANRRKEIASQVQTIFEQTEGVVDVDWYIEDDQPKRQILVDREKAGLHGITSEDVGRALRIASQGESTGLLHDVAEKEDVPLVVRLGRAARSDIDRLLNLKLRSASGALVSLREITSVQESIEDRSIYHKNLAPVTYVTADIAGAMESPVYAILKLGPKIAGIKLPEGYEVEQFTAQQPSDSSKYAMKWDGEWHITYEVFRDLGIAFAAVIVLIYILVVGWFESFATPLVILTAIPFSLIGILPAHGLLNAFFTATSMIGFIAGAGIVVRNSIILVDFIELRLREGMPLAQAVVDAGAVRFRPMVLTAAAVVVGSAVIFFDPIFQGLAVALMAGEVASLLLSRMTVPMLYYMLRLRLSPLDPK